MEVILLKDLEHVGDKHTVVSVKAGYGRNYLIPQGVAVIANAKNRGKLDKLVEEELQKENAKLEEYKQIAEKLKDQSLNIGVKSGTSGKIFGKVTSVQVISAIKETFGVEIERRKVDLPEEPKEIGEYPVVINLHPDVKAEMKINLVKE